MNKEKAVKEVRVKATDNGFEVLCPEIKMWGESLNTPFIVEPTYDLHIECGSVRVGMRKTI